MKKIFILSHAMFLGGAERSLLGLLNSIDYKNYSVDLFLFRHEGELLDKIPDKVNLLPQNKKYATIARSVKAILKEGHFILALKRLKAKLKAKRFIKKNKIEGRSDVYLEYSHKYIVKNMPKISKEEYDLAISFLTPHYFAISKVNAKKKVAWIHTDYSTIKVDAVSEEKMWGAYDNIISISDKVTESFVKTFPSLEDKIVKIGNILVKEIIEEDANAFSVEEEMPQTDGEKRLLSIGRFCEAKNFDNVPFIAKSLIDGGVKFKWYIIGFGEDEDLIRQNIIKADVEDSVIILGKKDNPYPYIKACDVYVQPSRYEGKAVTVIEAQILNKPVVIADYETSKSQLIDGVDGKILPMDNESFAKGLKEFVCDKKLQAKFIENCKKTDYTNKNEVLKLYDLIKDED